MQWQVDGDEKIDLYLSLFLSLSSGPAYSAHTFHHICTPFVHCVAEKKGNFDCSTRAHTRAFDLERKPTPLLLSMFLLRLLTFIFIDIYFIGAIKFFKSGVSL